MKDNCSNLATTQQNSNRVSSLILKTFIHTPNSTSRKKENLLVWRLRDRATAAFDVVINSLSSRQSEMEIVPFLFMKYSNKKMDYD